MAGDATAASLHGGMHGFGDRAYGISIGCVISISISMTWMEQGLVANARQWLHGTSHWVAAPAHILGKGKGMPQAMHLKCSTCVARRMWLMSRLPVLSAASSSKQLSCSCLEP